MTETTPDSGGRAECGSCAGAISRLPSGTWIHDSSGMIQCDGFPVKPSSGRPQAAPAAGQERKQLERQERDRAAGHAACSALMDALEKHGIAGHWASPGSVTLAGGSAGKLVALLESVPAEPAGAKIRWEPGKWGNQLGYAGTREQFVFQIYRSDVGGFTLTAQLPGVNRFLGRSDDAEGLKPAAEAALAAFVASLGAAFVTVPASPAASGTGD